MKKFGDSDKSHEKASLGNVEPDRYGEDTSERLDSLDMERGDAYGDDDRPLRGEGSSLRDDDRSVLDDDRSLLDDDRSLRNENRPLFDRDSHGTETTGTADGARTPIFPTADAERFRTRWMEIQTDFVDEPRRSVEHADELVSEVTERLTSIFKENRGDLERQWTAGDEVSTEDLRRTLQRYRSFFERLLTV